MDRYALFVDAGYFFAAGSQAAFGERLPRKEVALKSPETMIKSLRQAASEATDGLPPLRTYWYDAMPGPRLSQEQSHLAMMAGIKLRLGALNSLGEQKGVDSLIVTDIIDLAKNRAIADAVVVSGDEDLRISVQVAQSFGVRVHILAAGDASRNVSAALRMEADSVLSLSGDWFASHLEIQGPRPAPAFNGAAHWSHAAPHQEAAMPEADLETIAHTVIHETLDGLEPHEIEHLGQQFAYQSTVPPEYDRRLIAKVAARLSGRRLSSAEMRHIRNLFIQATQNRQGNVVAVDLESES